MNYLDERETIKKLLSLDSTELKEIVNQRLVEVDENGGVIAQFEIIYDSDKDIKGHITIRYDAKENYYKSITLDVNFSKTAGENNYSDLYELAPKFMKLIKN